MALSLCSDWGAMEGAMVMNSNIEINGVVHQQYPPPGTAQFEYFGTSPSSLDTSDLQFLEYLFNGSPSPDDYVLPDPSLDPHHFSSLLSSDPDPSTTAFPPDLCPAYGEPDAYGPFSVLFGTNPFGAAPPCLERQFLPQFPFASPMGKPEAMALQTPSPAPAMSFSGAGGYTDWILTSGVGGGGGGGCPSAQSVAARQRRKRISEKTHELGQLVPGGCRMTTAEMLQAAFNYVKFLQAQVGVLDLMRSLSPATRGKELERTQHLQALLLASPAVHEKLASEERCVVPACMVQELLDDKEIKSHPSICEDLRGLTSSMG